MDHWSCDNCKPKQSHRDCLQCKKIRKFIMQPEHTYQFLSRQLVSIAMAFSYDETVALVNENVLERVMLAGYKDTKRKKYYEHFHCDPPPTEAVDEGKRMVKTFPLPEDYCRVFSKSEIRDHTKFGSVLKARKDEFVVIIDNQFEKEEKAKAARRFKLAAEKAAKGRQSARVIKGAV
ncbi:hypothetical protein B0T22DRAFT_469451 [Podospora appendiculata]|uniref:Uncharacterized protein n=1 Tax=Podospora appendiculata TaxID=314037 RepID=A0AAE0X3H8_9PEZI|nr:hypothetical protein B0T22DRAFT_469451 [Podospora appendiculata]